MTSVSAVTAVGAPFLSLSKALQSSSRLGPKVDAMRMANDCAPNDPVCFGGLAALARQKLGSSSKSTAVALSLTASGTGEPFDVQATSDARDSFSGGNAPGKRASRGAADLPTVHRPPPLKVPPLSPSPQNPDAALLFKFPAVNAGHARAQWQIAARAKIAPAPTTPAGAQRVKAEDCRLPDDLLQAALAAVAVKGQPGGTPFHPLRFQGSCQETGATPRAGKRPCGHLGPREILWPQPGRKNRHRSRSNADSPLAGAGANRAHPPSRAWMEALSPSLFAGFLKARSRVSSLSLSTRRRPRRRRPRRALSLPRLPSTLPPPAVSARPLRGSSLPSKLDGARAAPPMQMGGGGGV